MINQKGIFIVLDGGDGSGKALQTRKLIERLEKEGYKVKAADFPQYGNWSAEFVERYLRGEFGSAQEVLPKQASLFYALDRYAARDKIKSWLNEGFIVISNRYVSSNKGHQLGKIFDKDAMKEFLNWINDLEYNILKIPIPNLTLYLHMSPEIGQQLVDKKPERDYIQGKKRDIHEDDLDHLKNAERAYLFCLDNDSVEKWKRIVCYAEDRPKPIGEIHDKIYEIVKEII
ncbi:MAG: thymidylate kinase [Candidatus Woesearchaeota archaeon]